MGEAFLSPSLNAFPHGAGRRLRSSQGMNRFKRFNSQIILFPKTDIPENYLLAAAFFHPPPFSQFSLTHFTEERCNFYSAAVFPLTTAIKKKWGHKKGALKECFTSEGQFQ